MTLPPHMVVRLRRLIPLLASPMDGEALAARNAIARELAAGRCDWHDLAASIECGADELPTGGSQRSHPMSFGDIARAARDLDRGQLSPKERAFVGDMVRRGFTFYPSPRQAAWLADILSRLEGRAAA